MPWLGSVRNGASRISAIGSLGAYTNDQEYSLVRSRQVPGALPRYFTATTTRSYVEKTPVGNRPQMSGKAQVVSIGHSTRPL